MLKIQETGLHGFDDVIFLGALSDGIINCDRFPERPLEIKSLYKYKRCVSREDVLLNVGDSTALKKK